MLDELVSGSVTKTYTYGLQRSSENKLCGSTWTPTFYGYNGWGNVVRFLASSTGTVGNTYQFDAFGMPIASTGTTANTSTAASVGDSNIGLYQVRARYYNQATSRFLTRDPLCGNLQAKPVVLVASSAPIRASQKDC